VNHFEWPTNDTSRIRTLQELRSTRVAQTIPNKEIDDWLKESVKLVAGSVRGLAANQRRVRYFGFERSNEQDTK
jgi:hypothetical protein